MRARVAGRASGQTEINMVLRRLDDLWIGVPWWDTIPSNFVEEADRNGLCVTAVNLGVPYHFSRQEAVYFATKLMSEPKPDVVVFLDGLNEFSQPGSSIRAEPFFTPTLDRLVPIGPDPSRNVSLGGPWSCPH